VSICAGGFDDIGIDADDAAPLMCGAGIEDYVVVDGRLAVKAAPRVIEVGPVRLVIGEEAKAPTRRSPEAFQQAWKIYSQRRFDTEDDAVEFLRLEVATVRAARVVTWAVHGRRWETTAAADGGGYGAAARSSGDSRRQRGVPGVAPAGRRTGTKRRERRAAMPANWPTPVVIKAKPGYVVDYGRLSDLLGERVDEGIVQLMPDACIAVAHSAYLHLAPHRVWKWARAMPVDELEACCVDAAVAPAGAEAALAPPGGSAVAGAKAGRVPSAREPAAVDAGTPRATSGRVSRAPSPAAVAVGATPIECVAAGSAPGRGARAGAAAADADGFTVVARNRGRAAAAAADAVRGAAMAEDAPVRGAIRPRPASEGPPPKAVRREPAAAPAAVAAPVAGAKTAKKKNGGGAVRAGGAGSPA
jgi:hypothetical protein